MADYTYEQLSRMQQQAAQRVREMKKRARQFTDDASRQGGQQQEYETVSSEKVPSFGRTYEPRQISMPNGLQGKNFALSAESREREQADNEKNDKEETACEREKTCNTESAEDESLAEADRALVLSLCFLLYAEGADEGLLAALMYLLV